MFNVLKSELTVTIVNRQVTNNYIKNAPINLSIGEIILKRDFTSPLNASWSYNTIYYLLDSVSKEELHPFATNSA